MLRLLVLLVMAATGAAAVAKPPEVTALFPAGAARGQTVEVKASGSFDAWPVSVWVDGPGLAVEPLEEKGSFRFVVANDAMPGPRYLRFHNVEGASAVRSFLVGTMPDVLEMEPNDGPDEVQAIETMPAAIHGRLARRGDIDAYQVELQSGETLVASLEATRLGSPMDGVIQVVGPTGFVLEQMDDSPGLDPKLAFTPSEPGRYQIRVFAFPETPDSSISFAGGDTYVYQLTLTTGGYLVQSLPTAVHSVGGLDLRPIGWNLGPDTIRATVEPWTDGWGRVSVEGAAGYLDLPILGHPCLAENELDVSIPFAPIPSSYSGRLLQPGETDRVRFELTKDQTIKIRVEARAIGSPLDPVIRIVDADGKTLAEQDDNQGRDVEISFKAPADGIYEALISDLVGQGGPLAVYRLDLIEPKPDFTVSPATDRIVLEAGKSADLTIEVARRDGFDAPIEIQALDLPAGVRALAVVSEPKGDSSKKVTLKFEADAEAAAFSGPLNLGASGNKVEHRVLTSAPGVPEPSIAPWLTVIGKKP